MRMLGFANLHDPERYEAQIEKMFMKTKMRKGIGALFDLSYEEVPLFSFGFNRKSLANMLAEAVRKENYFLSPLKLRLVKTKNKNKKRYLYQMNLMDQIVVGVLSRLLTEMLLPFLNRSVYSYRRGTGPKQEVRDLAAYIRDRRKEGYKKGVFLLQTDIASYSDEIYLGDASPFWEKLEDYFDRIQAGPSPYHWYLIQEAMRPSYTNLDGDLAINVKGAPTGSPITTVLYNYYVACIDFYMTEEPTLFYGRYSDDIIFCHPDPAIIDSYEDYLHVYLKTLSLHLSEKKSHRYHLTTSGFSSLGDRWKGVNSVNVLGSSISALGQYCISSARASLFLQKLRAALKNCLFLIGEESKDKKLKMLCEVANSFLDPSKEGYTLKELRSSTDRSMLKHLDYLIALMIAEILSATHGVKAFRTVSYRSLREEGFLRSLLQPELMPIESLQH